MISLRLIFSRIFPCNRIALPSRDHSDLLQNPDIARDCDVGWRLPAGDLSVFLLGQSLRTRLRVPHVFVDGSSRPMEARHRLSAMGGAGALGIRRARFLFYPPASWTLGAALGAILPWKMVPGAYCWIVLTLAGAAMYRLARKWLPASDALFAAVFYAAESVPFVDRLLAQRLCRTAGCRLCCRCCCFVF